MDKLELIKRNCEEIITEEELKNLLNSKKKPVVYLGTAITGRPHIAYFFPILKLADFLKAGFKVKFLLSDITGALDNTPWDVLKKRYDYYEKTIPLMFESIGVKSKDIEFVSGLKTSLNKDYFYDLLKLSTITSVHDAKKAASEVVKFGDSPKLSGLIYPLVQSLDEQYLGVDVQCGGVDQRKIFVFARENLPKIGYKRRIEVMTPLIPGLIGEKMSASDEKSKIDLLDDEKTVKKKINSANCIEGDINNGLLPFLKYVVMTIKGDHSQKLIIKRDKKYGGDLEFKNYEEIEKAFKKKELHPLDLKNSVADEINLLLKPFRDNFKTLSKLAKEAFEK